MRYLVAISLLLTAGWLSVAGPASARPEPLTLVVMDPLALPLSCPCVEGYAQRKYEELGKFLQQELGRPVEVAFDESLVVALKKKTKNRADLVIGKCSVVQHDARKAGLELRQLAALSGKDGKLTQTGLVVVVAKDPAKTVADLGGYRIIFGPAECDEKHAAALALLKEHQVPAPAKIETCVACSEGAEKIIELGPSGKTATVISSYAAPLLEGCGHIKKGDLRIVGETAPVPFIGAFVNRQLPAADQEALQAALRKVGNQPHLLTALETKLGFVDVPSTVGAKKN